MLGIRNFFTQSATLTVTASIVLVNTELIIPVAAGQTVSGMFNLFLTTAATGGVRAQVLTPAAPTAYLLYAKLYNSSTATVLDDPITSSVVISNALANAQTHFWEMNFRITNGVNAGNITLQFAQNSAANASSLLAGSYVDCVIF